MKKIDLKRLTWLLAVLTVSVVANASHDKHYSRATAYVGTTGAGTVYVSTSSGSQGSSSFASQDCGEDGNKDTHKYYFTAVTAEPKAGYTFKGWYASNSSSGTPESTKQTSYEVSVKASSTSSGSPTEVKKYAFWTANQYTVSFDTQTDDVANPASQNVTYASTYGTLPTPATRRFYTFNGWFTGATDGSQVTSSTKVTTASNHTLYAHWTLVKENQTLSWGGSMLDNMANGTKQAISVSSKDANGEPTGLVAFTYESDNESVIRIDGEYLVAVGQGSAKITVTQAGNTYFNSASIERTFTVLSKETPVFSENGFSADETCELKVGQQVTVSLTNVSDGLDGDFTVTASEDNVMGISRDGNTLILSADHAGTTTITVAQAETGSIYAGSKTYTFNVTRYESTFSLDKTELELEQTATLTILNTDGHSLSFVPEGIVSYDGSTGIITATAVGSTTLTVTQPLTNSHEAKEVVYTINVSKKTPTLTVKMNNVVRSSMSTEQGSTVFVDFDVVSDAEVQVSNVSGAQYASYVDGVLTAAAVGTAVYHATLPETETYKGTTVDFVLTVTKNNNHLPISGKSYTVGNGSATDWTHKYETLHFAGVPDKLSFNYAYIYTAQSNIGNPTLSYDQLSDLAKFFLGSVDDSKRGHGNTHMLYVEESANGQTWTTIWTDDDPTNTATRSSGEIQLDKDTRYIRFHHSCNFSNSYTNIQITELKYVEEPDPASINFGSAVINSGEVSKTSLIHWCNIAPLSVTSSNPRFTVTPTQFGNYEQYGSQDLTISYTHTSEAGTNEGDITISNGTYTKTIHVQAVTTKRPQTITWNADLAATGYAMNVGEQYPDSIYVPVLATATNGERITYTSADASIIEVIADTALLAKAIGEVSITAHQAGDDEYQEVSNTQTFQVTNKQKQSIQWDQNLYGLLTTSGSVELTATATSGGEITYTSANESVVKVNGNVLTVVGEGETYITATQAGWTDANEVEWLGVSQNNYVIVRNPASQCNGFALSQGSLTLNGSKKNQEYTLSGIPETLTFTAKHGEKTTSTWGSSVYSALIVKQFAKIDGQWKWDEVYNTVVGTSNTSSGNITLNETATKIQISTLETGTDHTISNIRVTRKKFMRADVASVNEEVECNAKWQQTITVSHSNIDLMTLTSKQGLISLSSNTLGEGCGSYGDDAFTTSFTPTIKNQEYKDTIVITDGKAQPSTILIPVRLYSKGLNQSINGFELPTTAVATDDIDVAATASSGLEVAFESSDNTIAYVENGKLVILQDGSVTITATQAGNEKYDAALEIAKTIVISKAATSINTAPTAADITYGQTLAEATLSNGVGSVEGTFAWETPDAKPVAGTHTLNVVFTPTQSGIYATASTLVSVKVAKATPVISTWPTAGEITIAQSVGESVLTGGETDTEGTFAWKNPTENRLHPGSYERTVVFTPEDKDNYNSVEQKISLTVINVLARIDVLPTAVVENPVFGMTLADVALEGGAGNVAGSFAWTNAATPLLAGTHKYSVTFTPEDLEFYSPVQGEISLTAAKAATSVVTAPTATGISYGKTLADATLNGGAGSVDGSFAWADETIAPNVGEDQPFEVIFTPADTANYESASTTVYVSVSKAAPAFTAPTAAEELVYTGAALNLIQAGSTQDGTLYYRLGETGSWATDIPVAINAGQYEIWYQVIGDDNHIDSEVSGPIQTTIAKATTVISEAPTAADITYGQKLSESALTGGTVNTNGSFAWAEPEQVPEVGADQAFTVIFTPTDAINYESASTTVTLTVNKIQQAIEWTEELTPMVITQTRAMNAMATSGLTVTYASSDESVAYFEGNVLHAIAAGTITLTASQAGDEHYAAAEPFERTIEVQNIVPVEPEITTAPEASDIKVGQLLSESELSGGVAAVEGTFAWQTPDTLLQAGTHTMNVVFTPEDNLYYLPTVFTVSVTVNKLTQTITWEQTLPQLYAGQSCSLEATASSGLDVTFISSDENIAYVANNELITLAAGTITLTAEQAGDDTYAAAEAIQRELTILVPPTTYGDYAGEFCQGDSVQFAGVWYHEAVSKDVLLEQKNHMGGDSIVRLVLSVHPVYAFADELTIYRGAQRTWEGYDLSTLAVGDTTLVANYTSEFGCDSVLTLQLTVLVPPTTYGADTLKVCSGSTVVYNGKTYKRNTKENVLLNEKNQYGGDSIVALVVKVIPVMKTKANKTIVEGSQETWQDIDLSLIPAGDTTLTVTYTSVYGCDSIFILNLTVTPRIATGMEDAEQVEEAGYRKMFYNGHIYIRKGDAWYDLMGKRLQ